MFESGLMDGHIGVVYCVCVFSNQTNKLAVAPSVTSLGRQTARLVTTSAPRRPSHGITVHAGLKPERLEKKTGSSSAAN